MRPASPNDRTFPARACLACDSGSGCAREPDDSSAITPIPTSAKQVFSLLAPSAEEAANDRGAIARSFNVAQQPCPADSELSALQGAAPKTVTYLYTRFLEL